MMSLPFAVAALLAISASGASIVALFAATDARRRGAETTAALQRFAAMLEAVRTTLELIDRRLAQQQSQTETAAGQLRELVIDRHEGLRRALIGELAAQRDASNAGFAALREQQTTLLGAHQAATERRHLEAHAALNTHMLDGFQRLQQQLGESLSRNALELGQRVDGLTRRTDERLREISGQVDRRLAEGFEKTTATFGDVLQRLALIDEAQKKITALSGEVVNLQQILADKRSRGAFGEVQLAALVRNVLPAASYGLQYTLPNTRVADCMLFLPAPTGMVAIDAKFPLESYRRMTDHAAGEHERRQAERQFKIDIRKHIRDIAERYIIPNVTSDGAMMFIPAEAVFAEIQAHHPDLVEQAHAARVWLVSPTTLWAILNTACAVLKDAATREQVHIIREHLAHLGRDFQRFRERMDQLARHVQQAHEDVQKVHTSASRISARFEKIEKVELEPSPPQPLEAQSANETAGET